MPEHPVLCPSTLLQCCDLAPSTLSRDCAPAPSPSTVLWLPAPCPRSQHLAPVLCFSSSTLSQYSALAPSTREHPRSPHPTPAPHPSPQQPPSPCTLPGSPSHHLHQPDFTTPGPQPHPPRILHRLRKQLHFRDGGGGFMGAPHFTAKLRPEAAAGSVRGKRSRGPVGRSVG